MKTVTFRSFLIFVLSLTLSTGAAETGFYPPPDSYRDPQGGLYKTLYSYTSFIQPRKAKKAQKKQDAKEKKKRNAIKDSSKQAQKRSYEIQSPEVQARMKQNKKDTAERDKARKKNNKARTKKGAKKYR